MKRASYDREIVNHDGYYTVECVECGKSFDAKRYDAAFCSPTCRTKNHRAKGLLEKRVKKAQESIGELISILPRNRHSKTFDALTTIRKQIDLALASVESEV